jgi:hypothetical protein
MKNLLNSLKPRSFAIALEDNSGSIYKTGFFSGFGPFPFVHDKMLRRMVYYFLQAYHSAGMTTAAVFYKPGFFCGLERPSVT